jgi:hypothetical protein
MRRILIIPVLFLTVLFSTPSYAKWTKVGENTVGNVIYVDFERIRKHGGYVYYWGLNDYLKPDKYGAFSHKSYSQGDCTLFRYRYLNLSFHKEKMGAGTGKTFTYNDDSDWSYPPPNSTNEFTLKTVCSK